jgi:hypothetical protein
MFGLYSTLQPIGTVSNSLLLYSVHGIVHPLLLGGSLHANASAPVQGRFWSAQKVDDIAMHPRGLTPEDQTYKDDQMSKL